MAVKLVRAVLDEASFAAATGPFVLVLGLAARFFGAAPVAFFSFAISASLLIIIARYEGALAFFYFMITRIGCG
jgi:hypothetical protein